MARKPANRRAIAVVMLLVAAGFGCRPLLGPFKFLTANNNRVPSRLEFYEKAKEAKDKKEIKVVVLTYRSSTVSPEFIGAERTLTSMFVNKLKMTFDINKERVTIVPLAEVDKFKKEHTDWRAMDKSDIGEHFGADYIIDMTLAELSLYEPNTRDLFRGHIRIPIVISDTVKDAAELFPQIEYDSDFPGGGQPVQADIDMNPQKFQLQFFTKVATELAGYFTALPTSERFR